MLCQQIFGVHMELLSCTSDVVPPLGSATADTVTWSEVWLVFVTSKCVAANLNPLELYMAWTVLSTNIMPINLAWHVFSASTDYLLMRIDNKISDTSPLCHTYCFRSYHLKVPSSMTEVINCRLN